MLLIARVLTTMSAMISFLKRTGSEARAFLKDTHTDEETPAARIYYWHAATMEKVFVNMLHLLHGFLGWGNHAFTRPERRLWHAWKQPARRGREQLDPS